MLEQLYPALALVLYLGAHLLRCVRLYVLSLGARRGGARLVAAHCLTAWPNALIPFKLGELLRITGFGVAVGGPFNGLAIWLVERLSDAIAVVVLAVAVAWLSPLGQSGVQAIEISIAFIVLCGLGAWVLLELVPYLRNDLLYRSRSSKGLQVLRIVHNLDGAVAQAKVLLVGRFSVTLLTAFLIWACEFAAIALWGQTLGQIDLFADDPLALEQRAPVFAILFAIGLVISGTIVVRRMRHAS